jgi:FemAB-related protein (PEP-CTERM system-associated)
MNTAITISEGKGWDEYVLNHPKSLFYHLYGWGLAFEKVFNFKKFYLQAKIADKVCGILPLILVNTLFGKKMISIPIGVYAGALSNEDAIEKMLIDKAIELTKELDCDYLEIRNLNKGYPDMPSKDLYVTFIRELPAKPQNCLGLLPRKARAAVREAIDKGLSYDVGIQYLDECYKIYAINQRYLGTPVVAKKWFSALVEMFKDKTNILVVKSGQRCIASVLTFFYKDTVLPFYGGCIPGFFELNPNNYMYLKLQEYGAEKGYKFFDFGRSRKDSGSYHFKINQGFNPNQLHYQYYLNKARKIPEISPSNKSFDLAKSAWRQLPLFLTKWLGPEIYKYVIP